MSETKKAVRLGKAARDFNVGMSTIVDFLASKGIEVDAKPNSKLDSDTYSLLLGEYKSDAELKEQSSKISNRVRTERKSVSIESTKSDEPVAPVKEEKPALDIHELQSNAKEATKEKVEVVEEKVEAKVEEKVEEIVAEEPAEIVEEKVEKTVESKVEITPSEPKAEEESENDKTGPKVLGTVDLDKIPGGRKGKKKVEPKKLEVIKKKEEVKKVETPKEEPAASASPAEPEVIRGRAAKLSGPTVVGKIELPKKPVKKSPVASSSDSNVGDKKKRKRKRVAKVDTKKPSNRPNTRPGQGGGKGRGRTPKPELSEADIQKEIKETLARLSGNKKNTGAKFRRAKRDAAAQKSEEDMMKIEAESKVLKLTEFVTVSELATMMNLQINEIISACMSLGIFASINQRLDAETISIITEEFDFTVEFVSTEVQEAIEVEEDKEEDLVHRAPIVTVMGHVDHGKTSLLDYVRKANVIGGEAGGITQHIGAYSVTLDNGKKITFLDTPGHEAFTAMRARGAQVTDIAIIVVAADDAVMPQTKEAINHAQAAGIPMIFAINKIDRSESNADKIKEQLAAENILVEDWGGKYQNQDISAKTGLNIDLLLEKVLLEAEMLELKANPNKRAHGTVIESELDKGRGYVTTMLVEAGTLKVGDAFVAGQWSGRVKAMHDERGNKIAEAGPSTPVSMLGLDGAPNAGDKFNVLADEKEARNIATRRQVLQREQSVRAQKHITIEEIGRRIALGEFKELNLIVKGDVNGSVEALTDSLQKLSTEIVQVNIIHKGVGQIIDSDVLLASASNAIIIGFQVRPSTTARKLAENEEIQIRMYSIIYDAINEMKEAMEGLLSAKIEEKVIGTAEIRETFKITKIGTIAGCFVLDGKIKRNNKIRLIRDGVVVYDGLLGSLKRFKDDVKEVGKGYECGLNVDKFNDIKVGDQIESYEEEEVKQTL